MTDFGNIDALLKTLPQHNVQPLWTVMNAVVKTVGHANLIVGATGPQS